MRAKFMKEVAAAGLPLQGPDGEAVIGEETLAPLPAPVRRYLGFMGVVGRRPDWSLRARFTGGFRMKPEQRFMPCEAWNYNCRPAVARIFHMRVRFAGFLPMLARDTYVQGRGRMRGRLLDLISVVDATGPELDIGELVTYLNDAILMAPSMVLGPQTRWSAVDEDAFDVALTDRGRTVTARVTIDGRGAVREFSTLDRYLSDPASPGQPMKQGRWVTPVQGWQVVDGRSVPTRAQAVWALPAGPFAYADFALDPASVAWNLPPGT